MICTGPTRNLNLEAYREGKRVRVEITAANGGRSVPEFTVTKREAVRRSRVLRASGYAVTLFTVTETGGLTSLR